MKINTLTLAALFVCGTAFTARAQTAEKQLTITINGKNTAQTVHNIGASGCWFSEGIGKYWPAAKREKIAELLFSREVDAQGNPKGIGLSAWRFNIGGGTTEQGDSSGIVDFRKRVESFLSPDGKYDWNKQAGYQWFLRKAKSYGVENLIAFSNTPPVQFTKNGCGFKTEKDYISNLKEDKYDAYTAFLTEVIKHFDKEGLHFSYISPVNEPQWDWSNPPGKASQEGSPWTNTEIHRVISSLNTELDKNKLSTKILTTEAGMLTYLYGGKTASSRQIQQLYTDTSKLSISKLKFVPPVVAGHSYFTDSGDSSIVNVRKNVADTAKKYGLEYWQSEYSMLADGFREGTKAKRSAIDCALFLAKIIHHDLTVGNASAWHLWNSYEPGNAEFDTRYYLIALQPNKEYTDGEFAITKNLWAMGNYSLFIRPEMKRVQVDRNDGLDLYKQAQDVMVSAYTGGKSKLVVVAINYTEKPTALKLNLSNLKGAKTYRTYTTSAADDLKASAVQQVKGAVGLKARSVTTIVFN
ncbi:beta-glycosidase [Mucilaginibacter sp. JRF]|uniref:glycoside hydrolase n=1 Tax=Mucilaginibacter sp. JRF TaxID=2780088 RepID=UPI00188227A9|nr:glycoside hydrolase [Mucilaginibacter sp. JRF]MBE9582987.1 beta-glycosidase [Mucilaginibacter sp. JRF]